MWLWKLSSGIVVIVIGLTVWYRLSGNSLSDLQLYLHSSKAQGHILRTWEEVSDGGRGQLHWICGVEYEFTLANGKKFSEKSYEAPEWVKQNFRDISYPYPIEVEYLPDDPTISRIGGDIGDTVLEWMWKQLGLSVLFLFAFLLPGVMLVKLASIDWKKRQDAIPHQL